MKTVVYEIKPTKVIVMTILSILLSTLFYTFLNRNIGIDKMLIFLSALFIIAFSNAVTVMILRLSIEKVDELEEGD